MGVLIGDTKACVKAAKATTTSNIVTIILDVGRGFIIPSSFVLLKFYLVAAEEPSMMKYKLRARSEFFIIVVELMFSPSIDINLQLSECYSEHLLGVFIFFFSSHLPPDAFLKKWEYTF